MSREIKILIVDDDPWSLRVVQSALGGRGYHIAKASDGTVALVKAIADPPDLVVSDVMMPGMDGWAFVRKVRANPRLAFTPFIFLTALDSAVDRLKGFRLGADDYLPKPFQPEELELRVASVLRRSTHLVDQSRQQLREASRRGFSGTIQDVGVASLLVLLEMERKTGLLVICRDRSTARARVFLSHGKIVAAFGDGQPGLVGVDVVYDVLAWSTGAFEFVSVPVEMKDEIGASTTHLLLEAARRADEGAEEIELADGDLL